MRINAISKIMLYLCDDDDIVVVVEMLLLKLQLLVENYFAMRYSFVIQWAVLSITLERNGERALKKVKKFIKCFKIKMDWRCIYNELLCCAEI